MRYCLLLLSLASCGYNWSAPNHVPTVSIPFVKGDEDGMLTYAITDAIVASGLARLTGNGEYELRIEVAGAKNDLTGFRIDPQQIRGEIYQNLLASEARRFLTLSVCLSKGGRTVSGPHLISADVDYDFVDGDSLQDLTFTDTNGAFLTVLPFSLGQLESSESAYEAAGRPLYRHIAQKVVDAISLQW